MRPPLRRRGHPRPPSRRWWHTASPRPRRGSARRPHRGEGDRLRGYQRRNEPIGAAGSPATLPIRVSHARTPQPHSRRSRRRRRGRRSTAIAHEEPRRIGGQSISLWEQTRQSTRSAAALEGRGRAPRRSSRSSTPHRTTAGARTQIALIEDRVHGAKVVRSVEDLTGVSPECPATKFVGFRTKRPFVRSGHGVARKRNGNVPTSGVPAAAHPIRIAVWSTPCS